MRAAALLLLLCAAAGVAGVPSPVVVAPARLQLSQAPWAVAALDLPPGADVALSLRPAVGAGAPVAAAQGTTDAGGKASLSLALSGSPPPGLYTLRAVSTSAAWQQAANVTLVGQAPLVVRAPARRATAHPDPPADSRLASPPQTVVLDKALYKPGETVQIRALSLGTDLLPLAGAQARPALPMLSRPPRGPYALRLAARATRRRGCA